MTYKEDKIVSLENTKKNKEIYNLGGLLSQIFSFFAKDLKPKLIACFESLDDTLFDLSEKADSNQNQSMYFDAMRDIRKQRAQIFSAFFDALKSTFKQFKNNQYNYFDTEQQPNAEKKSLSLVDEKELDETLAKVNLINKSDMAYHRHLYAFEKRFSVLASGTTLKSSQIPISPHVLVNAFSYGIARLDIDVSLKLIIYKLFERNIMGQLNATYTELNHFLASKGIVPEIVYHIGSNPSTNIRPTSANSVVNNPASLDNSQTPSDSTQAIGTNVSQANIDPNYQLISQLFSHSRPSHSVNNGDFNQTDVSQGTNYAPVAHIDMGSMLNALTSLQNNLFKNNDFSNQSPTEIKQKLLQQLHQSDTDTIEQRVNQKDEDTIDLVGMLFQFIVDDRNLPDNIQVILARLQIPYLKIALKDRAIFAERSHPARVLLDKLAIASVGWSEESDKNKIFISQLEKIAHDILQQDEYHADFYHTQVEKFKKFYAKLKKKSDIAQKRSVEKTLGQDKINKAKEQCAQQLVEKMHNQQMPKLIRDLLLGEWANVLVLMHLRYGIDSDELKQKIDFIDLIIDYSTPKPDRQITAEMIKAATDIYQQGLNLVAFNPKESLDKQHQLIECLHKIHAINPDQINQTEVEMIAPEEILKLSDIRKQHDIAEFIEEIIEPTVSSSTDEAPDEHFVSTVKSLKIGTWLEFLEKSAENIRAKLSWISPITTKYLFVNSRGLKIADKSQTELAVGLKNKDIRILQQVALFDRALSAIANKMQNSETETQAETQTQPQPQAENKTN